MTPGNLSPKVLLVDDDIQQLQLRAEVLLMSGFSPIIAAGPREALAMMARGRMAEVEVAIVDYNMPVMNGCELADRLKTAYPRLKIILHSGVVDIPWKEMNNVDVFVPKSEGTACLVTEVTRLLCTDDSSPASSYAGDELRLQLQSVQF